MTLDHRLFSPHTVKIADERMAEFK